MSSVCEKDSEWFQLEKNFIWIAANFTRFTKDIDISDEIGQEFKNLSCVKVHQGQTNCLLMFFRKIHDILIDAGCEELRLPPMLYNGHDYSKYSVGESAGYSEKWDLKQFGHQPIWWKCSVGHHMTSNPHHPTFWKQVQQHKVFGWSPTTMPTIFISEALIDGLAHEVEKKLGISLAQAMDPTNKEFWFDSFKLDTDDMTCESVTARMMLTKARNIVLKNLAIDHDMPFDAMEPVIFPHLLKFRALANKDWVQ